MTSLDKIGPNAIATVSISGTLEAKLRAAAAAGFRAVEIFDTDFVASALSAGEVRALLDELGLACVLYQPLRDVEGMPEPHRARALARARQKFEVMRTLGCDRLLLCSNTSPLASGDRATIVADLRAVADLAREYDVTVGYEALAWGRHVYDHRDVWDIVQAVDHPNLGILLDSFHSLARNIPSESIRAIDPAKLVFVQLADAPRMEMDYLYWSRHFRNLPGQGGLDLTTYVAEILRIGYTGPLSLEIFNDRFRASSAEMVARDGLRALDALRDAAARKLGRPTAMPARATIERIAFVEFAVAEADRAELAQMLTGAGFDRVGRHRDKAVELWRCGAANFVLNFEDGGFADAYRTTHGTAICAIGLVVTDGPAAMARARALGLAEHPSDLPAMPALRGVAGSLVYVLDREAARTIWEDEFVLEPASGDALDVVAIDHLAVTVHNDEFLSWQLYWRALFDVDVAVPQDVIDPNGLVQSQAIRNRDGSFRITLNSTDAREALSARFLSQSFGAGFQHIALRVPDVAAAAATLAERGLERLPIPGNYHEDVAARFALSPEEDAAVRRYGILVDEEAPDRRFHQLYSRAFARTFFFEYVDRSGGYDGYGAPNATIRLTAQNRFRPAAIVD